MCAEAHTIFVYYFKSFLTINDVQTLLQPLTDTYFKNESSPGLDEIYDKIFDMGENRIQSLEDSLRDSFQNVSDVFGDIPEEEAEYLSYDVFVKKMLIEQLIDELSEKQKERETEEKKKEKKKKS